MHKKTDIDDIANMHRYNYINTFDRFAQFSLMEAYKMIQTY